MTYWEMHKALEAATTAEEARNVVRQYGGPDGAAFSREDDDVLMRAFVYRICTLNGTHWTQELID